MADRSEQYLKIIKDGKVTYVGNKGEKQVNLTGLSVATTYPEGAYKVQYDIDGNTTLSSRASDPIDSPEFKTNDVKMISFEIDNTAGLNGETGKTGTIKVVNIKPDNTTNRIVNATSDNTAVATVKDNGDASYTVSYLKAGKANITFTSADGSNLKQQVLVTITDPIVFVSSFNVNVDGLKLSGEAGKKSAEFTIDTIKPDNATDKNINFSSADNTIATVASTGSYKYQVSFVKAGTTKVTFVSNDGKASVDISVTVTAPTTTTTTTTKPTTTSTTTTTVAPAQ